jgi:hypothetical protein
MKDVGAKDVGRDLMDVERALAGLKPVAAPAGLRDRVMDRATEARKSAALSPRMRILAAACSIVIVIFLGLDPLMGRHETARMTALLDGRPSARPAGEAASDLAEILAGQGSEANRITRFEIFAVSVVREEHINNFIEARKRLKGWLEDESFENPD